MGHSIAHSAALGLVVLLILSTPIQSADWSDKPVIKWANEHDKLIHFVGGYATGRLIGWKLSTSFWLGIEVAQVCEFGIKDRWEETLIDIASHQFGIILAEAVKQHFKRKYKKKAFIPKELKVEIAQK